MARLSMIFKTRTFLTGNLVTPHHIIHILGFLRREQQHCIILKRVAQSHHVSFQLLFASFPVYYFTIPSIDPTRTTTHTRYQRWHCCNTTDGQHVDESIE